MELTGKELYHKLVNEYKIIGEKVLKNYEEHTGVKLQVR